MKPVKIAMALILLAGSLGLPAWAAQQQNNVLHGFPNDWSHRHLIFSKPRSAAQLEQFQKNPRYQMQQAWRNGVGNSAAALDAKALQIVHSWGHPVTSIKTKLKKDWSVSMGTGTHGSADVFPAKYGFASDSASCKDYVDLSYVYRFGHGSERHRLYQSLQRMRPRNGSNPILVGHPIY